MDILNSEWLIQMLNKANKKPQQRLLGLFDILDDWSNAPGVRLNLDLNKSLSSNSAMQTYLSLEAAKAGAALPEALASQLYFMAIFASHEKLEGHNTAALQHAKSVAKAVINAQTKKEFYIAKSSAYAITASFIATLVIAGALFVFNASNTIKSPKIALTTPFKPAFANAGLIASPQKQQRLWRKLNKCDMVSAVYLKRYNYLIHTKKYILRISF